MEFSDAVVAMSRPRTSDTNSKLAITSFLERVTRNKNERRLQCRSIQHCILRRLRSAFCGLKLSIIPRKKQSAQDWYRSRLLSSIFGAWLSYTQNEQLHDSKLCIISKNHYKKAVLGRFTSRSLRQQVAHRRSIRNTHLSTTYFSSLRLLESFEMISDRVNRCMHLRDSFVTALNFEMKKRKTAYMGKLNNLCS